MGRVNVERKKPIEGIRAFVHGEELFRVLNVAPAVA